MKKILVRLSILLLVSMTLNANAQKSLDFPDVGDDIIANYPKVEWIKGEPIAAFEKNKIYIIELWATWCKPCIAAMPHLNSLYGKFKDKIVFVGQNVMEDKKDLVYAFVKERGDGLSYPIAYAGGTGSDFDLKWLKPGFINSIPQTFIIQNNKLAWVTHPANLNEKVLQLLVDNKFTIDRAKALVENK